MEKQDIIWVTGAKGFLGGEVCAHLEAAGKRVVGTDAELSVSDSENLERFAQEVMPAAIVNCAGIRRDATTLGTRIKAYEVNALGARNVALAANAIGALMVQVSSDDVYAAVVPEPVNEFDNPHPTTPYGKSKRAGEMMVRNTTDDHLIVRSSWLYHAQSGRFRDILDAAEAGRTYAARTDQVASPTSVDFYCKFLVAALDKHLTGTFHVANTGSTSRYGFAAKIRPPSWWPRRTRARPSTWCSRACCWRCQAWTSPPGTTSSPATWARCSGFEHAKKEGPLN